MNFTDIATAIGDQLEGLIVKTDTSTTAQVPVVLGIPQQDYFKKLYPLITVSMINMMPAYDRQDTREALFAFTNGVPYLASRKKGERAFDIQYQIDLWSRLTIHSDRMLEHVLLQLDRDKPLFIKPVVLTADAAETATTIMIEDDSLVVVGDYLTLDERTTKSSDALQVVIVAAKNGGGELVIEPALKRDFSQQALCYESTVTHYQEQGMYSDFRQDASMPYTRRVLTYTIWGWLQPSVDTVPYVKPDGPQIEFEVI